jgi:hypothetical protein
MVHYYAIYEGDMQASPLRKIAGVKSSKRGGTGFTFFK